MLRYEPAVGKGTFTVCFHLGVAAGMEQETVSRVATVAASGPTHAARAAMVEVGNRHGHSA